MPTGSEHSSTNKVHGPTFRRNAIAGSPSASVTYLYRARNRVERFFNKIKHCRRIATRYDKLAANYLAFVQLASIRLWLRVYEFTT
jgi:transposase